MMVYIVIKISKDGRLASGRQSTDKVFADSPKEAVERYTSLNTRGYGAALVTDLADLHTYYFEFVGDTYWKEVA